MVSMAVSGLPTRLEDTSVIIVAADAVTLGHTSSGFMKYDIKAMKKLRHKTDSDDLQEPVFDVALAFHTGMSESQVAEWLDDFIDTLEGRHMLFGGCTCHVESHGCIESLNGDDREADREAIRKYLAGSDKVASFAIGDFFDGDAEEDADV